MKTMSPALVGSIRGLALWLCAALFVGAAVSAAAEVPFRLIFNAYDGDPRRDKPEQMAFQINTVDLRQPSEFLKIGNRIPNTPFKLTKYEYKVVFNPSAGSPFDLSELTIAHQDTGETVVLILTKVTNVAKLYQPPPKAPR